jgi:voltage-gated potassium channel
MTAEISDAQARGPLHDSRSASVARLFERLVLLASLLVIPAIVVDSSHASAELKRTASLLNWGIWLVFVAEMVTMLALVPDRRRWLRENPLNVAIVVVTVPFLPASLQAARVFRLARLVRLALVLRLARRLLSPSGLRYAAALLAWSVLGGAAAFQAAEQTARHPPSLWDSIWWAMATVTTVGYGDVKAHTVLGRLVGIALMLVGIGFVAVLTAAIAQRFLQGEAERIEASESRIEAGEAEIAEEFRELAERLARLEARILRERPSA